MLGRSNANVGVLVMDYTKKPVTIKAIQYTLDSIERIIEFIGEDNLIGGINENIERMKKTQEFIITTNTGDATVKLGDYIIKGVEGEFYPCPESIFLATYNLGGYSLVGEATSNLNHTKKTFGNTDQNAARKNVKDIVIFGEDLFKLLSKASSENERWMKSTKAMEIPGVGCVVQVSTQQGDIPAEALVFVPGVKIVETLNSGDGDKVAIGRKLVKIED